ncbi:MAG: hypothetical protein ISS69_03935 [Phycisphaerae bacterium]|nr:hypothetical protein [Planctomycetota bacterium]MBL7219242.1 hypothetical protein [Phycisphaerae bacterium]
MSELCHKTRVASHTAMVQWVIVVVLSVIATCLVLELGFGASSATAQVTSVGGDDMLVVGGQITKDSYGLYLVDMKRQSLCVYQWLPGTRKLRLMAARTFKYDVQLDEYNADKPTPRDVKRLVEQNKRLGDEKTSKAGGAGQPVATP